MLLEYRGCPGNEKPARIEAVITTGHAASSFGMPVVVLRDGTVLDSLSWVLCRYRVVRASEGERAALARLGIVVEGA